MTAVLHILTGIAYFLGVGGLSAILVHRLWRDSRRGAAVFIGLVWMALSCGPHHAHLGLHLLDRTPTMLDTATIAIAMPFGVAWLWWQAAAIFCEKSITLQRTGGGRFRYALRRILVWVADHWPSWWHTDRRIDRTSLLPHTLLVASVAYASAVFASSQPDHWSWNVTVQVILVGLYLAISAQWWVGQFRRRLADGYWSAKGITLGLIWTTCAVSHWSFAVAMGDGKYPSDGHMLVINLIGIPAAALFIGLVWWLQRRPSDDRANV